MSGPSGKRGGPAQPRLRLDKWLWQARFFRSRSQSCDVISEGFVRVNGQRMTKPGHGVTEGDVLTFAQAGRIRLIRVAALGQRRGPPGEAQALFADLDPQSDAGGDGPTPLE